MYLSCLLVEDGIRHLFHINLTVSCLFSSYSLACVSAPSSTRHLRLWNRRPHRASSLIFLISLSWTTHPSRSRYLCYIWSPPVVVPLGLQLWFPAVASSSSSPQFPCHPPPIVIVFSTTFHPSPAIHPPIAPAPPPPLRPPWQL